MMPPHIRCRTFCASAAKQKVRPTFNSYSGVNAIALTYIGDASPLLIYFLLLLSGSSENEAVFLKGTSTAESDACLTNDTAALLFTNRSNSAHLSAWMPTYNTIRHSSESQQAGHYPYFYFFIIIFRRAPTYTFSVLRSTTANHANGTAITIPSSLSLLLFFFFFAAGRTRSHIHFRYRSAGDGFPLKFALFS